jgi:phosphoglycerate dehydrogenase-like enzyme
MMTPMTVTIVSLVGRTIAGQIGDAVPEVEVVAVSNREDLDPAVRADGVITNVFGSRHLPALVERGARWVHTLGTGVDGFPFDVLDGQVLTCGRGASSTTIAEWVLGCMLAFAKQLPETWIHEPSERWGGADLHALAGATLGLVGLGGIGSATARRALAFDMEVLALRRRAIPTPVPGVRVVQDLDEVLAAADHLVLTAPATPDTHQLLRAETFALVKPGVHLVNIARGSLVDQDALREALDDGRVAMASLDVCDPEPLPAGHWLYSHPRVRLSAHVSSSPVAHEIVRLCIENVRRFVAGEPLAGVVDLDERY